MNIVEIRLTVPSGDLELGQVLTNDESVRVQLARLVPTGETFVPYFWAETDDFPAYEERVRSDDRVATLQRVEVDPETCLYNIEWATALGGFIEALPAHNLVVDSAVGGPDEWRFRLRGPDHENLSAFCETLRDAGIENTVERVWNARTPDGDAYGLTAKQREAVTLAFTNGYFDVPSGTNLTELAEHVEVTRQSFSRRLNRGIQQVVATTLMADL